MIGQIIINVSEKGRCAVAVLDGRTDGMHFGHYCQDMKPLEALEAARDKLTDMLERWYSSGEYVE